MNKKLLCVLLIVVAERIVVVSCGKENKKLFRLDDEREWARPGISPAEVLEARGYVAKEFTFTTRDGYRLTVTRGTNPLISRSKRGLDNKLPILFLHGAATSSSSWVLDSIGVRPRVYDTTGVDMADLTTSKLAAMTKGDPSVRSLAFLAMNFGHEVWLLDRRGFGQSRGKLGHENRTMADALKSVPSSLFSSIFNGFSKLASPDDGRLLRGDEVEESESTESVLEGQRLSAKPVSRPVRRGPPQRSRVKRGLLSRVMARLADFKSEQSGLGQDEAMKDVERTFIESFDPDYWRFSLDENAEIDFPQAIDLVLNETGQPKLHTAGMSAGGAVILLGLAAQPDLVNKVAKVILWAPAVNMGSKSDIVYSLGKIVPFFQGYVGPVPLPIMMPAVDKLLASFCEPAPLRTMCERLLGMVIGFTGGQMPIKPLFLGNAGLPTAGFELIQLGQFARTETPCKLQFESKEENIDKYGQEKAPCYDLGKIKVHNMSLYVGNTDMLVSPDAVRTTVRQLNVPAKLTVISKPGVFFNHAGFYLHKDLDKLAVLPSLLDIEREDEKSSNEVDQLAVPIVAKAARAQKRVDRLSRV